LSNGSYFNFNIKDKNKMKNVKSTKTLMSFSDSSMNLSEMKKVNGGTLVINKCPNKNHFTDEDCQGDS
jgi:hypothetical protein